MQEEIDSI
jgi:hypothetical protein